MGAIAEEACGTKVLSGFQERISGRGSGDEVSQKLKQFADIVYTAETTKIHLLILDRCVSQ